MGPRLSSFTFLISCFEKTKTKLKNGKGLRQAYSLQHTWKIQVMSSWQEALIKVNKHTIFVFMWPFLGLLHLSHFFFLKLSTLSFLFLRLALKIPYAFVIYPPLQRQPVTGTLLPLTKWLQWSHYLRYLHTRYQEKTRLLITFILLRRFQLTHFSVLVI